MNRPLRIALLLVVVAAAAGLTSQDLGAQPQPPITMQDACRVETADATVSWSGAEGQFRQNSPDTAYATGGCPRYVVDVDVGPFTVQPHGGYGASFQLKARPVVPQNGMIPLLDQQQCESLELDVVFYRAGRSATLERISGGRARGQWQAAGTGACILPELGSGVLQGSTSGTTRYRVAASARLQGSAVTLSVKGVRTTNP